MKISISLSPASTVSLSASTHGFKKGDRVVVKAAPNEWYLGTVERAGTAKVKIGFDDGNGADVETEDFKDIKPLLKPKKLKRALTNLEAKALFHTPQKSLSKPKPVPAKPVAPPVSNRPTPNVPKKAPGTIDVEYMETLLKRKLIHSLEGGKNSFVLKLAEAKMVLEDLVSKAWTSFEVFNGTDVKRLSLTKDGGTIGIQLRKRGASNTTYVAFRGATYVEPKVAVFPGATKDSEGNPIVPASTKTFEEVVKDWAERRAFVVTHNESAFIQFDNKHHFRFEAFPPDLNQAIHLVAHVYSKGAADTTRKVVTSMATLWRDLNNLHKDLITTYGAAPTKKEEAPVAPAAPAERPGVAKFKVGDRVRRDPKVWKVGVLNEKFNRGVIIGIEVGEDNKGKASIAYKVKFDAHKPGDMHSSYLQKELVALKSSIVIPKK